MRSEARLTMRFLGPPEVLVDGSPLQVDTRKAIALLATLAVEPGPHSRESLATLLWPESDVESARAALRRTLSALNHGLAHAGVTAQRESIELNAAGTWSDVQELTSALDRARGHGHPATRLCDSCASGLTAALEYSRGEFLAGFGLRDSAEFDDWQGHQASRLRSLLFTALDMVVDKAVSARDFRRALALAEQRLAMDGLNESAHRVVMRLYGQLGDRAAAVRQYRECLRLLDRELGVPPAEETTRLYRDIVEGGSSSSDAPSASQEIPDADAPRAAPTPKHRPGRLALVGRSGALSQARMHLLETRGAVAVVTGPVGVGRTRFLEELRDSVAGDRRDLLLVGCHEGEAGIPYAPIAGLLRSRGGEGLSRLPAWTHPELALLVPDLLLTDGSLRGDPGSARLRFIDALATACASMSAPLSGALLAFDDLQFADESTLEVLAYILPRAESHDVSVVLSWRMGFTPPQSLASALTAAWRSGRAVTITLGPLSMGETAELLPPSLRGSAQEVFAATQGRPGLIAEYIAASTMEGSDGGGEAWASTALEAFVGRRLDTLDPMAAEIVTVLSVVGAPLPLEIIVDVAGRGEAEVEAALERLTGQDLVRPADGADRRLRFEVPGEGVRAAAYHRASAIRRQVLHRRAASALSRVGAGSHEILGLAAHQYLRAGDIARAESALLEAAAQARGIYALPEARAFLEGALALGTDAPAAIHEEIADLLAEQGAYREASIAYQTAAARGSGGALSRIDRKLGRIYTRLGRWELAEQHFALAESTLAGDDSETTRVLAEWSVLAHRRGDHSRAAELARRALAAAGEEPGAAARARNALGITMTRAGDGTGAAAHLREGLAAARLIDDRALIVALLNNLSHAEAASGRPEIARSLAQQALAGARAIANRHDEAAILSNLADLAHDEGNEAEAMEHLKASVRLFAEVNMATSEGERPEPEIWKLTEW
ncbi:MAG: BTAD domain-containing putative transcriptional regulator [Tepidiformaceae bacterium]